VVLRDPHPWSLIFLLGGHVAVHYNNKHCNSHIPFSPDIIGGDHGCKSVNTIPTGIAQGIFPTFGENKKSYCGVHKVGIFRVLLFKNNNDLRLYQIDAVDIEVNVDMTAPRLHVMGVEMPAQP
jgi:hypothetical protein